MADANVVSCNASSAGGVSVSLVDAKGCVLRPDLITPFVKTRETNGIQADLMLYAYMKVGCVSLLGKDNHSIHYSDINVNQSQT